MTETNIPNFLYGTAWKEHRTRSLTELALKTGFVGIDTANQRKHYWEEEVGYGLLAAYESTNIVRENIFLQTKYTFARGQDHRLPYNLKSDIATQVTQSLHSSLLHLHTHYLDSYVLHGPSLAYGLSDNDWEAWHAMEKMHQKGLVKFLGISNVSHEQLALLYKYATVKPAFVQNRCFAQQQWDKEIRQFCKISGITYQGFSLLTANKLYLDHPIINDIAQLNNKTTQQIIFKFAQQLGILPLTGTSDVEHMKLDLDVINFTLAKEQIELIENIAIEC